MIQEGVLRRRVDWFLPIELDDLRECLRREHRSMIVLSWRDISKDSGLLRSLRAPWPANPLLFRPLAVSPHGRLVMFISVWVLGAVQNAWAASIDESEQTAGVCALWQSIGVAFGGFRRDIGIDMLSMGAIALRSPPYCRFWNGTGFSL